VETSEDGEEHDHDDEESKSMLVYVLHKTYIYYPRHVPIYIIGPRQG